MKTLSIEEVEKRFESRGCKLLSTSYQNNKTLLIYKTVCNHQRESNLYLFERWNRILCEKCGSKYFDSNFINPKTFKKRKSVVEGKILNSLKYRIDFERRLVLKCIICQKDKNSYLFYNDTRYKNDKQQMCKICFKNKDKEYKNNRTQYQILKRLLKTSKTSALKRNIENNITLDDLIKLTKKQEDKCIYTGVDFVWKTNHVYKPSIDRIDSDKGYTTDNIQFTIFLANQAKNSLKEEEFLELIKKIYEYRVA